MNDIIMGRMISGQVGKIPQLEKRIKLLEKAMEKLIAKPDKPILTLKKRGRPPLAKND